LHPKGLEGPENEDCKDIADLAYHIITKKKRIQQPSNQTLLQKKLRMKWRGEEFSIEPGFGPVLVDFLEACEKCDMGLLINVS
jgi:hypothetical protein